MPKQSGRRSAAEMSVAVDNEAVDKVHTLKQRPPPPSTLKRGSRAHDLWMRITGANVVDYFSEGDLPLLEAFCQVAMRHEEVTRKCVDAPLTTISAQGTEGVNPLFRLQDLLTRQLTSLAVKLRISASTRYDEKSAGMKARRAVLGEAADARKPWQRGA